MKLLLTLFGTELRCGTLLLKTQANQAEFVCKELDKVIFQISLLRNEGTLDLKGINNIMVWNVNTNLERLASDDMIIFLESFVEKGGL